MTQAASPSDLRPDVAGVTDAGGLDSATGVANDAGIATQPAAMLNFREHMWDRFEILVRQRAEPSRRYLEAFVICLRERATLERQYGKAMARAVNRATGGCEDGSMPVILDAVTYSMRNRSEHSLRLADELDQDVAPTIESMLRQHAVVSKKVFADGQRLSRHLHEEQRAHDQLARRYAQVCSSAEDAARECLEAFATRPTDWKRSAERSIALSREASSAEREYYKAVQRLNAAADVHGRQMGNVLAALQDMEEKRASCFRDAAMKIAVYDTSWLRNVQYDLDSSVQTIEASDAMAEIQEFITQHRTTAPPLSRTLPRGFWEVAAGHDVQRPAAIQAEVVGSRGTCREVARHTEAITPVLRSLLARPEPGGEAMPDHDSAQLEQLRQSLAAGGAARSDEGPASAAEQNGAPSVDFAAPRRRALCESLQAEIQAVACGSKAGEIQAEVTAAELPTVQVGQVPFDAVVSLVSAALDGCDRDCDAWNGRDLMVLSQKIQCITNDLKAVDVLLKVYNHPLWSRVTFWEDVLILAVTEAQALQVLRRRSDLAGTDHLEVASTAFLQRYVGYMTSLGIKAEQAKACVQRTLRKNAQLLGQATESYVNLLSNSTGNPGPTSEVPSTEAATRVDEQADPNILLL